MMYGNYDNPRVTVITGRCYGALPACVGCGLRVDADEEYLALHTGTRRADLVAVAHPQRWVGPGDDDWDTSCAGVLRDRWMAALAAVGAGLLHLGADAGGARWFLGEDGLHAGTPMEVLDSDGFWHAGRFEYHPSARGPIPRFHLALAGWDVQDAAVNLPATAVVRVVDP